MRLSVFVALLCFAACGLVCGLSCPTGQFRSSVPGRCCNLCPAGHFMSKECQTSANDTQCSPCRSGTYNAKENKDTACRNCRTSCPDQKETIVKNCSLVSDNQCKCSDNYYWDPHSLQCRKCTLCMKKGQVLVSRCEENKDAVCKACGKENFLLNNKCVPCDRCHKGEFVVEECSPKRNTVCRKLPTSTPPSSSPHINSQEPVTGTKCVERADLNPTPAEIKAQKTFQDEMWVYRAVIMLLVLIILGLVLHQKINLCQTIKTKVTTLKKCSGPKESCAVSAGTSLVIKENNFKFSKTRADVTERLAMHLNASKDWKRLAGLMNYSSIYTQNWEITPTEATQKLLQDWSQRSDATVFTLYQFLKELHRDDAASLLLPYLTGQVPECETV